MSTAKVAITMDESILRQVDRLVAEGLYPSRSRAIQDAVCRQLERRRRRRLTEEAAKLDPKEERALAEEGLAGDAWPES